MNFYTQDTAEGDEKALCSCRACDWSRWGEPGAGLQDRIDAAHEHIAAAHPGYAVYESPSEIVGSAYLIEHLHREAESLRGLVSAMAEALVPQCCHLSGMHDPLHFVEGRYLCDEQKAEAWHRAVLLLGLGHYDSPEAAKGRPDSCYFCHSKGIAA